MEECRIRAETGWAITEQCCAGVGIQIPITAYILTTSHQFQNDESFKQPVANIAYMVPEEHTISADNNRLKAQPI